MVSDLAILKFLYKYGPEASWILNVEIHKKANEKKAKKHVIFFIIWEQKKSEKHIQEV